MSEEPTIAEYLNELVRDAAKLHETMVEAARHLASGDEQWACNVVALSHYTLSQLEDERENLLSRFKANGITPRS